MIHLFAFSWQMDAHEAEGSPRLFLGRSQAQQKLIARRRLAAQSAPLPQQTSQLASPHGSFLGAPPFALGQPIKFSVLGEQLHLHRLPHFPPRQLQPLFLVLLNLAPRRAHQVKHFSLRGAHLLPPFLRRNSPLHHPDPPSPSGLRFDLALC